MLYKRLVGIRTGYTMGNMDKKSLPHRAGYYSSSDPYFLNFLPGTVSTIAESFAAIDSIPS